MDYQGNTRKERERAQKESEKQIEKVTTSEVIEKPKSIGHKMKNIFFGGDFTTAVRYVSADIFLPALRNLIVDVISKGTEKIIFGDSPYRRSSYDGRPRFTYNNPIRSDYRDSRTIVPNLPDQRRSYRNRREVNDIIITSREEAELVVERLFDIFEKYQVVALADLYQLIGLPTSHIDNKWGWTYINNIEIRQIREGFLIELPPLEEI